MVTFSIYTTNFLCIALLCYFQLTFRANPQTPFIIRNNPPNYTICWYIAKVISNTNTIFYMIIGYMVIWWMNISWRSLTSSQKMVHSKTKTIFMSDEYLVVNAKVRSKQLCSIKYILYNINNKSTRIKYIISKTILYNKTNKSTISKFIYK